MPRSGHARRGRRSTLNGAHRRRAHTSPCGEPAAGGCAPCSRRRRARRGSRQLLRRRAAGCPREADEPRRGRAPRRSPRSERRRGARRRDRARAWTGAELRRVTVKCAPAALRKGPNRDGSELGAPASKGGRAPAPSGTSRASRNSIAPTDDSLRNVLMKSPLLWCRVDPRSHPVSRGLYDSCPFASSRPRCSGAHPGCRGRSTRHVLRDVESW